VNKELPSKLDHIGYITNGGFSLALGHGFGIGACSIDGLKNIKHLDEK
jgi:ribonuclease P/MRP protein subunit POP1